MLLFHLFSMFNYERSIDDRNFNITKISLIEDNTVKGFIELVSISHSEWMSLFSDMKSFKLVFNDLDCEGEKEWISDYNRIKDFFVNKPSTDYIFIEEEYRGQGLGEKLYKEALSHFKSLGYEFIYSDNILSEEGSSLLKTLEDNGLASKSGDRYIIG